MDSMMTCDVPERGVPFTVLLCILLLGMCIGYFLARYMITKMLERVKREKTKSEILPFEDKLERSNFLGAPSRTGLFPMPSINVQDMKLSLDRLNPMEGLSIFDEDSEIQPVETTDESPNSEIAQQTTPVEPIVNPVEETPVEPVKDAEPEPEPLADPSPTAKPLEKTTPKKKTRTTKTKKTPIVPEDSIVNVDSGVTETSSNPELAKCREIEI